MNLKRATLSLFALVSLISCLIQPAFALQEDSQGHQVLIQVDNPYEQTIKNFGIDLLEASPFVENVKIAPVPSEMEPGGKVEALVTFDIGSLGQIASEEKVEGKIRFLLTASEGFFDNPVLEYRFEVEPRRVASCNDAVGAGSDQPETIEVDLEGFQGTAGFAWEMFRIKDRMILKSGGQVLHDTGCARGSSSITFPVDGSAGNLTVSIEPNCEGTSGTKWNFNFECPATSITAQENSNQGASGSSQNADAGDQSAASSGNSTATTQPQPTIAAGVPSVTSASGNRGAEQEPNNASNTPNPLVFGTTVQGTILPKRDGDLYAIDLPHQGQILVRFPSVPAELNIAFRVLKDDGKQFWKWQTSPTAGAPFEAWVDIATAGRYLIEVKDGRSDASSPTPYEMVVLYFPTADIAEPNDKPDQATPLPWDTPIEAQILPKRDGDIYAVDLWHQGQLSVLFEKVPPEINIAFRILTGEGKQYYNWQTSPEKGEPFEAWVDIRNPGRYLIEVKDGRSDARSALPYRMIARLIPTADSAEPNDKAEQATPLAFGQEISANILPKRDGDIYAVDLPKQGELAVRFPVVPPELNIAFRVLRGDGKQFYNWQTSPEKGEPFEAWVDIASPGRYLIEVKDGRSDARSAKPYRMVAKLTQTVDPDEPNNKPEQATPLALGQAIEANILPKRDGDIYAVDLPRSGRIQVHFDKVPPEINIAFQLLNAKGQQIYVWQTSPKAGEPFTGNVDIGSPGRYLIEVKDGRSDARSTAPYRMTVTLQ